MLASGVDGDERDELSGEEDDADVFSGVEVAEISREEVVSSTDELYSCPKDLDADGVSIALVSIAASSLLVEKRVNTTVGSRDLTLAGGVTVVSLVIREVT